MKIIISFFCLLLSFLSLAASADTHSLTVQLTGVREAKGLVQVELYRDAKSFRKTAAAERVIKVPASQNMVEVHFDGVPSGTYAVMAFHDEDENGQLNKRFGMFPLEGYALSNDPEVMGPPAFKDSAFELQADQLLVIPLHYK